MVTLFWSALQLLHRYMALEETSSFVFCIPAPLFLARRFHVADEKLSLFQAAQSGAWYLTLSDVEALLLPG